MNGIKFFNKDDPIIYKLKDIIRLLMFIGLIIAVVYVKPITAKIKLVEDKQLVFQIEIKEQKDAIEVLKTNDAVNTTTNEQIFKTLDSIQDDLKFLIRKSGGE